MGERDGAAGEKVLEPPWGRYEHVGSRGPAALALDADAPVCGGDLQAPRVCHVAQFIDDLCGEFARRCEHERPWALAPLEAIDDGKPEGERLKPEPVGDFTSRSWPASASGIARRCTGNGRVMPRRSSAPATASDTTEAGKGRI